MLHQIRETPKNELLCKPPDTISIGCPDFDLILRNPRIVRIPKRIVFEIVLGSGIRIAHLIIAHPPSLRPNV